MMAQGAAVIELSFSEVVVADWARAVRFYADVLGLRLVVDDAANGFALFEAGRGGLALKRGERPASQPPLVRLVFRVADVDSERERLLHLGITVGSLEDNLTEGYRSVELHDPEGTPITLFSWIDRIS